MLDSTIFTYVLLIFCLLLQCQGFIWSSKEENWRQSNIERKIQLHSSLYKYQPDTKSSQEILETQQQIQKQLFTSKQGPIQFLSHSQIQESQSGRTVSKNTHRKIVYSKIKPLEQKVSQANLIKYAISTKKTNTTNFDEQVTKKIINSTTNQANLTQSKPPATTPSQKNTNNTQKSASNSSLSSLTVNNNNSVGKNNISLAKATQIEGPKNNQTLPQNNKSGSSNNTKVEKIQNSSLPKQAIIKNDSRIPVTNNSNTTKSVVSPVVSEKKNQTKPLIVNPVPTSSSLQSKKSTPTAQSIDPNNLVNSPFKPTNNTLPTFDELANSIFSNSNNFFSNSNDQTKKLFDNFFNNTNSKLNTDNFFGNALSFSTPPTKKIVNKQFTGIGLYHDIPLSFLTGEVFKFYGIVLNPSTLMSSGPYKYNFVNIVFSEWGSKGQFRCVEEVSVKELEFQISCRMQKAGRYLVSIFPGETGQSSTRLRSVRDTSAFMSSVLAFNLKTNYPPTNISCDIVNNKLEISWGTVAPLTNLTIYQQQKSGQVMKKQYLLSNYHDKFMLPFAEFAQFQPVTTNVEVCHADSDDGTLYQIASVFSKQNAKYSFQAVEHKFSEQNMDVANIQPSIPWRIKVGDKIKFNATFKENIKNEVYLILPTGKLTKVNFAKNLPSNSTVRAGTPLDLEITFVNPGTYILEINAATGLAIINRPIYVGQGLPLIPDHKDLIQPTLAKDELTTPKKQLQKFVAKQKNSTQVKEPTANASLSDKRNFLLLLLNNLRKQHQVGPVVLDDQLNAIAQYHSDDMNKNNYFSHTSLNGDGPGQRAKRFNFTNSIGENIAQSNSLTEAHLNLQRSADHLENSIKPEWRRVGVGIATSRLGQYYVTFQFSGRNLQKQPLTKDELQSIRKQTLTIIFNRNPNIKKQNPKLSTDVSDWMDTSRTNTIFQYLFSKKYSGSMSATSFSISYSPDVVDRLDATHYLEGFYRFQEVGLALKMQKGEYDMLEAYAVFA